MNTTLGALSFDATINTTDFNKKFDEMNNRIRGFTSEAISSTQQVDNSFQKLGTAIGAYLTFEGLKGLATQMVTVRNEFQQMETALKVMLGSKQKANELMGEVADLASKTPYTLREIGSATKMMIAYGTGVEKSVETIRMLGDVASGVSQPLNDIAYLYGTLQTQGRAYSVDIKQFAGRGIPIYKELATVLNTSEKQVASFVESGRVGFKEVEQAFKNMTSQGGMFNNAMEEQSKTIGGLYSTLTDNIDMMFNDMGKKQEGLITDTIKMGITMTQNYENIINTLTVLVATYGAYRTAVMIANVLHRNEASQYGAISALVDKTSGSYAREIALKTKLAQASANRAVATANEVRQQYVLAEANLNSLRAEVSLLEAKRQSTLQEAQNALAVRKTAQVTLSEAITSQNALLTSKNLSVTAQQKETAVKAVATAQTKLSIATENAFGARKRATSALTEFNTKKIALETVAKEVNTLGTQVNTTAVIANTAVENANAVSNTRVTAVQSIRIGVTKALAVAEAKLTAVMMANPYALIIALIAGLGATMYVLSNVLTNAESAQKDFNDEQKNFLDNQEKIKTETQNYISIINNQEASTTRQMVAFLALKEQYKDALKNVDLFAFKTMDATKQQNLLDEALENMKVDNFTAKIDEATKKIREIDEELKRLNKTTQAGFTGGVDGKYLTLINERDKELKLRRQYTNAINDERRKERKANEALAKAPKPPVIKNRDYYEERLKELKQEQSKYDLNSKMSNFYQKKIDNINDILNPKKGKKEEVEPFGSLKYWESVQKKAQEAVSVATSNGERQRQNAIMLNAQAEAEKIRNTLSSKSFEEQLSEKKKQYELYEKWVTSVSQESADEQFSELIKKGKSYSDYLTNQIALLEGQQKGQGLSELGNNRLVALKVEYKSISMAKTDIETFKEDLAKAKEEAKSLSEYLAYLQNQQNSLGSDTSLLGIQKFVEVNSQIAQTRSAIKESLKELVNNSNDNEQQLINIQVKYQRLREDNEKSFTDKKNVDYLRNKKLIDFQESQEILTIEENRAKNLNSFKKLQDTLYSTNRAGLKKRLADEKAYLLELEKNNLTRTEAYKEGVKEIGVLEKDLEKDTVQIVNSFSDMASDFGNALSDMKGTFGELGRLLSGLASSVKNISISFDSTASTSDKISGGIAGITTLTNLIIDSANERERAEKEYRANALKFEHDYKIAINERLGIQAESQESPFIKDFQGRLQDGFKKYYDASAKYKEALSKLNEGQAKKGQQNAISAGSIGIGIGAGAASGAAIGALAGSVVPVVGTIVGAVVGGVIGLFAGKKKEDIYGNLLQLYPDLIKKASNGQEVFNKDLAQTLLTNNQVDDATKALLENTIEWTKQMDSAKESIKNIIGELAGKLGDNLRNALVDAFKAGTSSAKAFGEAVSGVLEDVLSQLIFNQVFSNAFKKLTEDMTESSDVMNGGDNTWIDDFGRFFAQAEGLWQEFNKGLENASATASAYGLPIFQKNKDVVQSSLSGAIKGMSQETATVLAGQFNVIRINTATQVALTREANIYLAQMTNYQVTYLPYLKNINENLSTLNNNPILRAKGTDG